jgi:hypothetical protein
MSQPRYVASDASAKAIDDWMAVRGFSALKLDAVGGGCPDRLYGGRGLLLLVELKTGKGKLRRSQVEFAQLWHGPPVYVWRTPEDARETLAGLGLRV